MIRGRRKASLDDVKSESPYEYFDRRDVVAEYASFDFLLPPERTILEESRPWLKNARMLDIGVGAGRTTLHFASLVQEYVGIDVSPRMIEMCRRRFADSQFQFAVCDVRDARELKASTFDFVLFSFNGLDVVGGHHDRLAALSEIHRICRSGAMFCFSSHNLSFALAQASTALRLRGALNLHSRPPSRPLRYTARLIRDSQRWRRLNPGLRRMADQGYGMIVEERYRFEFSEEFYESARDRIRVEKYYISPTEQIAQLRKAGFESVRAFSPEGTEVTPEQLDKAAPWWIYYLATKAA